MHASILQGVWILAVHLLLTPACCRHQPWQRSSSAPPQAPPPQVSPSSPHTALLSYCLLVQGGRRSSRPSKHLLRACLPLPPPEGRHRVASQSPQPEEGWMAGSRTDSIAVHIHSVVEPIQTPLAEKKKPLYVSSSSFVRRVVLPLTARRSGMTSSLSYSSKSTKGNRS